MECLSKEILSLHNLADRERLTWELHGRLCRQGNIDIAKYNNTYNKYLDAPSKLAKHTLDLYEEVVEGKKGLLHWVSQYNSKKVLYDFIEYIPKFMCQREDIKEVITILETAFEVYENYQQELKDNVVARDNALSELLTKINELNSKFFEVYLGFFIEMERVVKEMQKYYLPPLTLEEIAAQVSKKWLEYPYWTFDDFMNYISEEEKLMVLFYSLNKGAFYCLDSEQWCECMGKYFRFVVGKLDEYNYEEFAGVIEIIKKIGKLVENIKNASSTDKDYYKEIIYELTSEYSTEFQKSMPVIQKMVMEFQSKDIEQGFNGDARF